MSVTRILTLSAMALAGCGGGGGGGSGSLAAFGTSAVVTPSPDPAPAPGTPGAAPAPPASPAPPPVAAAPPPVAPPPPSQPPGPTTPMVWKVTEVANGLNSPWSIAFLPDGKMLVTQRTGQLRLRNADGSAYNGGIDQISGVPAVETAGQGGLLDVALDPAFATNKRIYFSFSQRDSSNTTLNGTAVARAQLDVASRSLSNVVIIYQQLPKVDSSGHFGSRLVFDRNGYLFVTLGDRQTDAQRGLAQDLTRGNGKVVRITTDGAPAPGNPTFSQGGALPHIWSYGHRNPQGAALHPATGDLWTNEHGPQGGDEVNLTLPGRNYGWPTISYGQEYGTLMQIGEGTAKAGMEQPVAYWEKFDGSAWTPNTAKSSTAPSGMAFYSGDALPDWKGNLFVGALAGGTLWRLTLNGNTVTGRERLLADRGERIRDVRQGPDGWLYVLTDSGKLLRLQR